MYIDPTGCSPFWGKFWSGVVVVASVGAIVAGSILIATGVGAPLGGILIGAGIGGVVGTGGSIISQGLANGWENIDWGQVAFNGLTGMSTGALMASPLGAVATGFAVGGIGFGQSVGNDLFENGGNWSQVNWLKAGLIGIASGALAGGGKFLSNNATLMNKIVNNTSSVKSLGAKSLELGLTGRGTYTAFWTNVSINQTIFKTGVSVGFNLLRSGSTSIINFL